MAKATNKKVNGKSENLEMDQNAWAEQDTHGGDCCSSGACAPAMCEGGACGSSGSCGTGMCCGPMGVHGGRRPGKMLLAISGSAFFLMAAILIGTQIWGTPWYKNIRAEFTTAPYSRTISVDGEGKISAKPDLAKISLSVVASGKTVKAVTDESNKKMNAVIDSVKGLGVKAEDIQSTEYNLYPEYDYNVKPVDNVYKSPAIIGYSINQTVGVKVRDLTKADDVLEKAVLAGANQVGSLTFDIDDASGVKSQARVMAFQKAREKAEQMATAAGVKIGKVVTFSESFNAYPMAYANFAMKSMDSSESGGAPSLEAGSKDLSVSVSVTYEIE